jgi:hypothetical protein
VVQRVKEEAVVDPFTEFLAKLRLDGFEAKLRAFGADIPCDLADVEDEELVGEMGMGILQVRQPAITACGTP